MKETQQKESTIQKDGLIEALNDKSVQKTVQYYKEWLVRKEIIKSYSYFHLPDEYYLVFKKLIDYFSLKEPKKGILCFGDYGCYKTSIMRFFQALCNEYSQEDEKFKVHRFKYVNSRSIILKLISQGGMEEAIRYAAGKVSTSDVYCFDEIGREMLINNYGIQINIITEILAMRYDNRLITHGITNFSKEKLTERYGQYIVDRMFESFIPIKFPNFNARIK